MNLGKMNFHNHYISFLVTIKTDFGVHFFSAELFKFLSKIVNEETINSLKMKLKKPLKYFGSSLFTIVKKKSYSEW